MNGDDIFILRGSEVAESLEGREFEIVEIVRRAYVAHGRGQSSLPHSTFLRFPGDDSNRIIALPAFLGDGFQLAGMKWIASFPGNVQQSAERASAVLVLNSCLTGHARAILEGSIISAKRTAGSAAAAASVLLGSRTPASAGLIGTGVINFEVARFLRAVLPRLDRFQLHDLDGERAGRFAAAIRRLGAREVDIAPDGAAILAANPLVCFATTAVRPHVDDLAACPAGAVILHISLRDLAPRALLACDNVVDDPDHVCRAQTSVHLAEQLNGSRNFIRCTLADILDGRAPSRQNASGTVVFSPFGLGILDLAVAKLAYDRSLAEGKGISIPDFLPSPRADFTVL